MGEAGGGGGGLARAAEKLCWLLAGLCFLLTANYYIREAFALAAEIVFWAGRSRKQNGVLRRVFFLILFLFTKERD